jgi:hypothetical protein
MGIGFSGDTLKRTSSIWDILGQTKVGQFFVNGDVQTGGINTAYWQELTWVIKTFTTIGAKEELWVT